MSLRVTGICQRPHSQQVTEQALLPNLASASGPVVLPLPHPNKSPAQPSTYTPTHTPHIHHRYIYTPTLPLKLVHIHGFPRPLRHTQTSLHPYLMCPPVTSRHAHTQQQKQWHVADNQNFQMCKCNHLLKKVVGERCTE